MKPRKNKIWLGVQHTINPQHTISDVIVALRPALVVTAELPAGFACKHVSVIEYPSIKHCSHRNRPNCTEQNYAIFSYPGQFSSVLFSAFTAM